MSTGRLSAVAVLAGHEVRRLWVQPWSWGLLAGTLALLSYFFLLSLDGFLALSTKLAAATDAPGVTDLIAVPLLRTLSNLQLLLVPLLTMRVIAGERRQHSLTLLLSAGIGNSGIVVGKWLACLGYLIVLLTLTAAMPLALAGGANLDFGKLAVVFVAIAFESAALCAIGVLASSWTAQPVLAAALALALNLLLTVLDAGARLQGVSNSAINYLALPTHLEPAFRGVLASVDLGYFALVTMVCLTLATQRVDALRSAD
ncbi:MAG: ABC transporter permease subunit [Tahibacter sp.]